MASYYDLKKQNDDKQTRELYDPEYNVYNFDSEPQGPSRRTAETPAREGQEAADAQASEAAVANALNEEKNREKLLRSAGINPNAIGVSQMLDNLYGGRTTDGVNRNFLDEYTGGWGKSKYDIRSGYQPGRDLEDMRANEQPWGSKVSNGLVKFGTTALTTAANTVGVAAGVVEGVADIVMQGFDKDSALRNGRVGEAFLQGLDAAVSNIITSNLVPIEDKMEELFPNFRTQEERSEEYQRGWWKPSHMITGNTIGDFFKNFGFTVGAMGGGYAAMKGLSKLGAFKFSSDVMKGVTAASAGDEAASSTLNEVARIMSGTGGEIQRPLWETLRKNIAEVGQNFLKTSTQQQLVGVTLSALSEGTIEGVMTANEFLEDYVPTLNKQYSEALRTIGNRLRSDTTGRFAVNGQLTRDGQIELENQRRRMAEEYNNRLSSAYDRAERMAALVTGLNLPILMTSDLMQFGRLFSGGFKTNLAAAKKLPRADKWATTGKETLKVGLAEMSEEMLQGMASSGAKQVSTSKLTEYNDDGFDENAKMQFGDWLYNFFQGAGNYVTDLKNWQEGFMGLVTGVLGIPGRRWKGGVIGAYQAAKAEADEYNASKNVLDKYLREDKFQEMAQDYFRHIKYDTEGARSLATGDKYSYLTADKKDLINAVIAANNIGRLNELEALADRYLNLSDEDVNNARTYLKGNVYSEEELQGMSSDKIRTIIGERAQQLKDEINEYRSLYDDLKVRVPAGADKSMLNEMIFLASMVNDFESRYISLFDETLLALKPYLEMEAATNPDGSEADDLKKAENLARRIDQVKTAFAGNIIPDAWTPAYTAAMRANTASLRSLVANTKNSELKTKVDDMLKLVHDRNNFYQRFETLQNLPALEWDENRKTAEKEEKKAAEKTEKEEVREVSDIDEMKRMANSQSDYVEKLRRNQGENPNSKTFLDLNDTYASLISQLNEDEKTEEQFPVGMTSTGPILNSKAAFSAAKREVLQRLYNMAQDADGLLDAGTVISENYDDFLRIVHGVVQRHAAAGAFPIDYVSQMYMNRVLESLDGTLRKYAESAGKLEGLKSLLNLRKSANSGIQTSDTQQAITNAAFNVLVGTSGIDPSAAGTTLPPGNPSQAPAQTPPPVQTPVPQSEPTPVPADNPSPAAVVEELEPEEHKSEEIPPEPETSTEINPTDQAAEAVSDGAEEAANDADRKQEKGKIYEHMNNAYSELDVDSADEIREALAKMDNGALVKASKKAKRMGDKKDFKKTSEYLYAHNAYDNLCNLAVPGSTVYFVIDKSSNLEYGGKPQVLLAVKDSEGNYRIVGTANRGRKYRGSESLNNAVIAEYNKARSGENLFVFSKTATIFRKCSGFVLYDYPDSGKSWTHEKPLYSYNKDTEKYEFIDGYTGSQNIVYKASDGTYRRLDGTVDTRWTPTNDSKVKRGSFFYISDNVGLGSKGIRLGVAHLNNSTKNLGSGIYGDIMNALRGIIDEGKKVSRGEYADFVIDRMNDADAELTDAELSSAKKQRAVRIHLTGDNNLDKGSLEVGKIMQRLGDMLYMQGISINFQQMSDNVTYFLLTRNERKDDQGNVIDKGESFVIPIDDRDGTNLDKLVRFIKRSDRQLIVNSNNVDDMVKNGSITTNAQSLRQLNADIWFPNWDAEKNGFRELTASEKIRLSEQRETVNDYRKNNGSITKLYEENTSSTAIVAPESERGRNSNVERNITPSGDVTATENQETHVESETIASAPAPEPQQPAPVSETIPSEFRDNDNDEIVYQIVPQSIPSVSEETADHIASERKKNPVRLRNAERKLYDELHKADSIVNMRMDDRELSRVLRSYGLSDTVVDFLVSQLPANPWLRDMTPYEAFIQLSRITGYDLAKEYNNAIGSKIDSALEEHLINLFAQKGITVKLADLREVFGRDNIAGAYDIYEKTVWMADNPDKRNKMTAPEEFSHAFVELMGSSVEFGADTDDFKFLYDNVIETSIYRDVYAKYKDVYTDENGELDEYRLRKEAVGQALAAAIVHNWDEKKTGKNNNNKSFWNQLRDWFERILDVFKGTKFSFERTIDDIAKEIVSGDLSRLRKLDDTGFSLMDYTNTLERQNEIDGGRTVNVLRAISDLGGIITGSLSYRAQGTVYRGRNDAIHDIDVVLPKSVHGFDVDKICYDSMTENYGKVIESFSLRFQQTGFGRKLFDMFPGMEIAMVQVNPSSLMVNVVYSDDPEVNSKFINARGSYAQRFAMLTQEERDKLIAIDLFFDRNDDEKSDFIRKGGLSLSGYKNSFREKLQYGRAKDIYDYQRWKTFDEYSKSSPNPTDILFQQTTVDHRKEIIDRYADDVAKSIVPEIGEDVRRTAEIALTINAQGPSRMSRVMRASRAWDTGAQIKDITESFSELFNSLSSSSEKAELNSAMRRMYGNEPNMYKVWRDYELWSITHSSPAIDGASEEDINTLKNIFSKIEYFFEYKPNIIIAMNTRTRSSDSYDTIPDIGVIPDFGSFDSISSESRSILESRGVTKEEYESSSELMQDKLLRCAGA